MKNKRVSTIIIAALLLIVGGALGSYADVISKGETVTKLWLFNAEDKTLNSKSLVLNELIDNSTVLEKRLASFGGKFILLEEVKGGEKLPRPVTPLGLAGNVKKEVNFSRENVVLLGRGPAGGVTMKLSNIKVTKHDIDIEIEISPIFADFYKPPNEQLYFFLLVVPKGPDTLKVTQVKGK